MFPQEPTVQPYFYPRPPRGGRPEAALSAARFFRFLSTPSARRATCGHGTAGVFLGYFYPRPPRGGRHPRLLPVLPCPVISIHALREEGDRCAPQSRARCRSYFYPRPPRGGRQVGLGVGTPRIVISIHALREEGDRRIIRFASNNIYFYPRPPRGGRRRCRLARHQTRHFYPRPPRGGRRRFRFRFHRGSRHFYPRPPRGGRPRSIFAPRAVVQISIHALREEGDWSHSIRPPLPRDFYPRPPRGGRLES